MASVPKGWCWAAVAVALVGGAWLLTSPGAQAGLGAHFSATLDSGDGQAGSSGGMPQWQPYSFPGGSSTRCPSRHPESASPNLTALAAMRRDWQFYPPSEGDL